MADTMADTMAETTVETGGARAGGLELRSVGDAHLVAEELVSRGHLAVDARRRLLLLREGGGQGRPSPEGSDHDEQAEHA